MICKAYKCGRDTLPMQEDGINSWHKGNHLCSLFYTHQVCLAACHAVHDAHAWRMHVVIITRLCEAKLMQRLSQLRRYTDCKCLNKM